MSIDDILMHDETIFRDIRVFNPDYVPDKFLHRESQMEALTLCLRPALKGWEIDECCGGWLMCNRKTTAIKNFSRRLRSIQIELYAYTSTPAAYHPLQHIFTDLPEDVRTPAPGDRYSRIPDLREDHETP